MSLQVQKRAERIYTLISRVPLGASKARLVNDPLGFVRMLLEQIPSDLASNWVEHISRASTNDRDLRPESVSLQDTGSAVWAAFHVAVGSVSWARRGLDRIRGLPLAWVSGTRLTEGPNRQQLDER